jgi:hypothetical protein
MRLPVPLKETLNARKERLQLEGNNGVGEGQGYEGVANLRRALSNFFRRKH